MNPILHNRLKSLDVKHKKPTTDKPLRVFYGWCRVNKVRKKEAISVIFENDRQREHRIKQFINRMQDTVYIREQTEEEKDGAIGAIRAFSEYSVFLNDKQFQGSLELALKYNSECDRHNVSKTERELIASKLRERYLDTHTGYKEPIIQLQLNI